MSNTTRVSPRSATLFLVAAFATGVAVNTASASLVAYDPFLSGANRVAGEYTAGTDMRTMGAAALGWFGALAPPDGYGTAHAGTTGNFVANATGENSPAVSYEQGGRMQWIGVGNFPFDRNLTRQLNPTPDSTTWWFSIMVNRLGWANSVDNTFAVGGFTDGSGNGLQVGYDDQLANDFTPDLVVRLGGANRVIETDAPSSSSRYVLIKLDIAAGNDTVSVWNNPAVADPLGAADFIWNDVNVSDVLAPFTQSKYQSPGQSGVVYFDEIRLGTDYASVVPEPGSLALALMGAGGLLALRRRQA